MRLVESFDSASFCFVILAEACFEPISKIKTDSASALASLFCKGLRGERVGMDRVNPVYHPAASGMDARSESPQIYIPVKSKQKRND
ncbi:MAG: hypothetical protein IK120_00275, partial [Muribaculaceae bacterium]|nr:hypothetical protein [Muribaculaceae bacterium]